MATNAAYRDMGMDTMERLYYEKQERNKNAYSNKHRDKKPSLSNKRKQMRHDSKRFQELLDESNDISLYC